MGPALPLPLPLPRPPLGGEGMPGAAAAALLDPYAVLGIPRSASDADVRRTYHDLARQLHPDKDRSVPAPVATARFQRLRAAYELLIDSSRRHAFDTTVVSAPFKPAARQPPAAAPKPSKRAAAAAGPGGGAKRPGPSGTSPPRAGPSRPDGGPRVFRRTPASATSVLVLDSEDEREEQARREEEWQAAETVRREHARRRLRRAEEQARRLRAREAAGEPAGGAAGAGAAPAGGARAPGASDGGSAYVRLAFRGPRPGRRARRNCKGAPEAPTAAMLEEAFADFAARVVRLDAESALLVVTGESRALGCALSFHGWAERPCDEATRAVYSRVRVVVAPVSADGRALPGPTPTVAATCKRVVACDADGGSLI
mmetsp:Transcript_16275/g.52077  ORF Transcript_16275/g.52077 Transcript_16275/m.52077 type:complete len:371 (-) Transcript_16275:43-1155(-)